MMILAALPGMVRELLVTGKIVNPGNFDAIVNLLGFRIRKVGLDASGWASASKHKSASAISSAFPARRPRTLRSPRASRTIAFWQRHDSKRGIPSHQERPVLFVASRNDSQKHPIFQYRSCPAFPPVLSRFPSPYCKDIHIYSVEHHIGNVRRMIRACLTVGGWILDCD